MLVLLKCLVDEHVQLNGQNNYARGKQVSVEPIIFTKKGQEHLFNHIDSFDPYKKGAEGLAKMGKISIELQKPEDQSKNVKKLEAKPEKPAKAKAEKPAKVKPAAAPAAAKAEPKLEEASEQKAANA